MEESFYSCQVFLTTKKGKKVKISSYLSALTARCFAEILHNILPLQHPPQLKRTVAALVQKECCPTFLLLGETNRESVKQTIKTKNNTHTHKNNYNKDYKTDNNQYITVRV